MRYYPITFIIIACCTIFSSCKKEGIGGDFSIQGSVSHHDEKIANATIWVAFGATEFPGNSFDQYDLEINADHQAAFSINELYKGNYYLYGMGYDSLLQDSVFGGLRVAVNKNNSSPTINLAVTEN